MKRTPKIFTSLSKANEWASSQNFSDSYRITKEGGLIGMVENGIEIIPPVHDNYEDLMDEWILIKKEEKQECEKLQKITPSNAQAQRAMYDGFDEECGF